MGLSPISPLRGHAPLPQVWGQIAISPDFWDLHLWGHPRASKPGPIPKRVTWYVDGSPPADVVFLFWDHTAVVLTNWFWVAQTHPGHRMNLGLWVTNGHYSSLDLSAYMGGFHPVMILLLCYFWSMAQEVGRGDGTWLLPCELPTAAIQAGCCTPVQPAHLVELWRAAPVSCKDFWDHCSAVPIGQFRSVPSLPCLWLTADDLLS